jgi:hypothetical protein
VFFSIAVNLRHSHFNKQFISQLEEGTYEVVHPFQIRDKKAIFASFLHHPRGKNEKV